MKGVMDPSSLKSQASISEDVVFRELDGEAVILNLETGIYFGLNETGTRIWKLIVQHRSLQAVLEAMAEEYDSPRNSLQDDLLQLVGQLCEKGLLTLSAPED